MNEREEQLKLELDELKTNGNKLFANRQKIANEFKAASDRADYLNDVQVQELKAGIKVISCCCCCFYLNKILNLKGFASERKLDEELGMTKRFIYNDFEKIEHQLRTFGQIVKIKPNHYEANVESDKLSIQTPVAAAAAVEQELLINNQQQLNEATKKPRKLINLLFFKPKFNIVISERIRNNRGDNPTKVNNGFEEYNNRPLTNNNNRRTVRTNGHDYNNNNKNNRIPNGQNYNLDIKQAVIMNGN